jgi:predicted TIM-barrel fold metal-dependent hydrolase
MTEAVDLHAPDQPATQRAVRLIDCDVHAQPTPAMLLPYLSGRARRSIERYGRRAPAEPHTYPRVRGGGTRLDAWPARPGHWPGSDPETLRTQLLEEWGIDYAILEVLVSLDCYDEPDIAAEIAGAGNDWTGEWLDFDDRLRAAIIVPHEYPELAIAEIERRSSDPRFVGVLMPASAQEQLGSRRYWPIYEAATAHRLPIVFHTGGFMRFHGAGPPSYYLGYHVSIATVMQSQLTSMVATGMFAALPDMRVVLTESGVSWVAAQRWALDAAWELMGDDRPRLERRPSEYIHEHVWFTTQPVEEPAHPEHLLHVIEQAQLADRLLFSTDYPHWDFDSPAQALPRVIPAEMRAAILGGNARELFGLPPSRPEPASY